MMEKRIKESVDELIGVLNDKIDKYISLLIYVNKSDFPSDKNIIFWR